MCEAISIVMSADSWWGPAHDGWNHSHSAIMSANGLPESAMGDKYARVEVTPNGGSFRDMKGSVLASLKAFNVKLDEDRAPGWWQNDKPAQIERSRSLAEKWLRSHPDNLVPGYSALGGNDSTLTGGYGSTLTGGNGSTLTWKKWDGARWRMHTFYIGEGFDAGVAYVLGDKNKPIKKYGA